jgi:hypothetical protein
MGSGVLYRGPACYVYFVSVGGALVYLGSGKPDRLRHYYSLSQDGESRTGGSVICDAARTHSHQQDMFAELQKLGQPFTFELYSVQGDVVLPDSVPVAYSGDGEPHAACKAEHLILHGWDFAMNAALNADYAWEELRAIWPQLGDVDSLPLRLLLARGQPGEQPPHLNGGRRLAAPVARSCC